MSAITHITDTLAYRADDIARWQKNPSYDYNRNLLGNDVSVWDMLREWVRNLLHDIFGNGFIDDHADIIGLCVLVLMVALIVWFVLHNNSKIFSRNIKTQELDIPDEDTIYGVDFDEEMIQALRGNNLREAVRLLYLRTLKRLSDAHRIDWEPSKTPSQYAREVNRGDFRELTNRYLRVRYGNFTASRPMLKEMEALARSTEEGGAA